MLVLHSVARYVVFGVFCVALLVALAGWLVRTRRVSPTIVLAYDVLFIALLARVIGSWLGMFRYSRWMRPAYALTDWLVGPISRVLPPMGMLDWSPLAAWLVLWLLRQFLLSVI